MTCIDISYTKMILWPSRASWWWSQTSFAGDANTRHADVFLAILLSLTDTWKWFYVPTQFTNYTNSLQEKVFDWPGKTSPFGRSRQAALAWLVYLEKMGFFTHSYEWDILTDLLYCCSWPKITSISFSCVFPDTFREVSATGAVQRDRP